MTLADRLHRARAAGRAWVATAAIAGWLAGTAATLALAAWALGNLRWIALPVAVPFIVLVLIIAAAIGVTYIAVQWWQHHAPLPTVTAIVERESGLRRGALTAALEVADAGALGAMAAAQATAALATQPSLAPRWRGRLRASASRLIGGAVAAIVIAVAASRLAPDGWAATWHPVRAARGTLLPAITLSAPPMVVRGSPLVLGISAPSRRAITLTWRALGGTWRDTLVALKDGRAPLDLGRVDGDVTVIASDGRATSDSARVKIVERPYLGDVTVRAVYPAYLERPDETLAPGEALRVPRGTTLRLTAVASVPLLRVGLVHGRDTIALPLGGEQARIDGAIEASASGVWSWFAVPRDPGPTPELPAALSLDVQSDSAPSVSIVSPVKDTTVTLGARLPVTVAAMDDHGIALVTLTTWRRPAKGGELAPSTDTLTVLPGSAWSTTIGFDAAAKALEPGDAVRIVAEVVDASPWHQRARSRELLVRVPALDEQRQRARAAGDSAADVANRTVQQQRALEKRTSDEAKALAKAPTKGPMTYEQAEKAKQIAADQRKMAEKAQHVGEQAQQLERQLKQAGALDSALAQRLREVQQLMKDALTPEMQQRLKNLEQAASQLSKEQAQQQMAGMQQDQQKLREQLERSAALLQRAALEGAMQTLKDEAKELAAREKSLADSMARTTNDTASAKKKAEALADRSKAFEEEVAKLKQRLAQEKAAAGASGAQQAEQKAKQSSSAMRDAAKGAGKEPSQAAADARSAADAMQQAAEQLAQARQQQIGEWKKDLANELDRAAQEMQQMAQQQQQLASQAQNGANSDQMRGDQQALQQGAQQAGERLGAQGKSSSLISQRAQRAVNDAKAKMQEAQSKLGEKGGDPKQASEAMKQAADALQQAASQLARDRDRVNKSSGASGLSEYLDELQKAAQQQGNAAQQAQQLMGLNPAQREARGDAVRAMARQQREVARQLEEAGANDATGKADEMAREARRIADRLEQGGPDAATLARQQQLFRRLLDAGKSLEQDERDEGGKREAKAGSNANALAPGSASARGAAAAAPTAAEMRPLKSDERRLVGEYFRRLNAPPAP